MVGSGKEFTEVISKDSRQKKMENNYETQIFPTQCRTTVPQYKYKSQEKESTSTDIIKIGMKRE